MALFKVVFTHMNRCNDDTYYVFADETTLDSWISDNMSADYYFSFLKLPIICGRVECPPTKGATIIAL